MKVWERRLGLIVPALNTVMEYEYQRMGGESTSVHTARISSRSAGNSPADREAHLLWMETQVATAADLLAQAKVDIICYGCTGGGILKGPGHDQEICAQIAATAGVPGTTTSASMMEALRVFGATRVSVATPYFPWLNERLQVFLEKSGFEVLVIKGVGTQAHSTVTPEQVAALAAEVDRPDSQAIVIACTNFRTLEIIEPLEEELGKPVVTSNAASLWKMLRMLGDARAIAGAGRLFREA